MSSKAQSSNTSPRKPKATRSRNGCWTCRSRKKKCDETHPECMQCINKGLKCEGYEARLKWGNGVASRGYLKGMNCPVFVMENPGGTSATGPTGSVETETDTDRRGSASTSVSGSGSDVSRRKKGSRKGSKSGSESEMRGDRSSTSGSGSVVSVTEVDESQEGSPLSVETTTATIASSLGGFDQELFREFKEWGSQCLSMASEGDYSPFGELISLCEDSESLMANCLMFQLSLHPEYSERFENYYAEALRLFRQDVCDSTRSSKDATVIAGVILCFIGIQNCKSWSMHLTGLYTILRHRKVSQNQTPIATELVSTIGFLDLPSHIVGRQTPTLNIWRDYCRGKRGIEPSSGLPYSLLDLFSLISEPNVEWAFWSWSAEGLEASDLQDMLWDLTRLAGIIMTRETAQRPGASPKNDLNIFEDAPFPSPPTEFLVERILSRLEDLCDQPEKAAASVANLLLFPAFVAGTQHAALSEEQKSVLEELWADFFPADPQGGYHLRLPLKLMRELWTNPRGRTVDQIAREWDVEIGLF